VNASLKIQQKLHGFIRRYYTNELIKGGILFLAFGLLYFLFTLLVEYFLWLKPTARTILFWVFISVELGLLLKYLLFPVFKLLGFLKGISLSEASKIIGIHFKDIDDKLLNMLQLQESNLDSEFTLASIERRAENLQPIPFKKAIRFSKNKKYLKYLLIPLSIGLATFLGKDKEVLSTSYNRVLHHQQAYLPPAPFYFEITNPDLVVVEGSRITLNIKVVGNVVPEQAKIVFNSENYFLKNHGAGNFSYSFNAIKKTLKFNLQANNVVSKTYEVRVIPTPKIQEISLYIDYPNYLNKKNIRVKNTGTITVPAGTKINWKIKTKQTDSLHFVTKTKRFSFLKSLNNSDFSLTKTITNALHYQIKSSNKQLKNYENLSFDIDVIPDELPTMSIKTDIDSISGGEAQFIGQLSDDYGLSKLQLVYYTKENTSRKSIHNIKIPKSTLATFYYLFPKELTLEKGNDYEFYFEVFDNDGVAGNKSVKSKRYSYHKDTPNERKEKLLAEEKKGLENLEKTLQKQEKNKLNFIALQKELQKKAEMGFNDTQKLTKFIKRQKEYQEMMQRQTEELQQNLAQQPKLKNKNLQEKKEALQKRIEEAKKLAKEEKLRDELQKLAEKMQKEDLIDRLKKMSKNSKEKSLAQLLELTKRFYVEQKAQQIIEKIEELAKKQEELAKNKENTQEKQEKLNTEFEDIQKDLKDLQKQNKALKEPMDIDEQKPEQEAVKEDQQKATEKLAKKEKKKAGKKQQSAAQKMKEMANQMQVKMDSGSGEMIEEDIAMLRQIIENLIVFSYKQEDLIKKLSKMHKNHPDFSKKLKEQNQLKTFFEHIDDSLYVLSMRQAKLSPKINKYLQNAHYYLDESLIHYADFNMPKTLSDQQYVMTAANDLALLLSLLLDNMKSSMGKGQGKGMGMGKGEGQGKGKGFSLPDIIKKQQALGEKMKSGMKGKKNGKGKEKGKGKSDKGTENGKNGKQGANGEKAMQEVYEIYKQQALLRQALESQLNDLQGVGSKNKANQVKRQMQELEQMLLEKGITNTVLKRMQNLEHELLKLKEAIQEQGKENKREAKTNLNIHTQPTPKQLEFKNTYYKQNEILNRETLPLKRRYKKKVQEYFSKPIKK